jgi:hypothetical protein
MQASIQAPQSHLAGVITLQAAAGVPSNAALRVIAGVRPAAAAGRRPPAGGARRDDLLVVAVHLPRALAAAIPLALVHAIVPAHESRHEGSREQRTFKLATVHVSCVPVQNSSPAQ